MIPVGFSPPESQQSVKLKNQIAWEVWRAECVALVPNEGQVYPPDFHTNSGEYGGELLIRLGGVAYYLAAEDNGWNCTEVGETGDNGEITRAARGVNCITTTIIDLVTGDQRVQEEYIEEENIPGIVYAVARALAEKEDPADGFYWAYVRRALSE